MTIEQRLKETLETADKQGHLYIVALPKTQDSKTTISYLGAVGRANLTRRKKEPTLVNVQSFWAVFGKISDCLSENSPENSYVKIFLEKCTKHEKEKENLTFVSF